MKEHDAAHLEAALAQARLSLEAGNYPVGAVLVIDDRVVDVGNNTGESTKTFINHAETSLVIRNAEALRHAFEEGLTIELYSSLEPCLMCLGAAVMNKVNRIVYAQSDPHAGACMLDPQTLGLRYHEVIQSPSQAQEARTLIVTFLNDQIAIGKRVEWCKRMLKIFSDQPKV